MSSNSSSNSNGGGSSTRTSTQTLLCTDVGREEKPPLVLRLRPKASVRWDADTVDNEHLCRKSSKRCCIYHSRKTFGESDSDESDSDIDEAERKEAAEGPAATKRNYQRHHA